MYDSTFTFKTRRKHHFLLTCLLILVQSITSYAIPIQCPDPCECYVNHNGIPSARCSEVYPNQSPFPNIHVLVLHPSETQDECNIPIDIAEIFPQLNFLYMTNCSLTNIPSNIFKDLQSLQEVDLSNNHIKKLDSSAFINNNKLRYVNLQNNPFHIADRPFLISKSLWELDLTSCNIHEIPYNMFKNLTHLKYLTLYDNKLRTLNENTLPNSLKTINLGKNHIKNVPLVELERIKGIRKIDLSENPVYCTCSLINFQSSMASNRAVTFPNEIVCAKPREYSGRRLIDLPEYELCDAVIQASNDGCEDGDICTNQIPPEEEKNTNHDKILDDFERDQVVPVDKKVVNYMDEMQSDSADEGSGDGTEIPELKTDQPKPEPETKPEIDSPEPEITTEPSKPSETPSEEEVTTQAKEIVTEKKNNVAMYNEEIASSTNTTTEKSDETVPEKHDETVKEEVPTTPVTITEAQPSPDSTTGSSTTQAAAEAIPPSSKNPSITDTPETETIKPTTENKTTILSQPVISSQPNQSDSSIFNLGYIIPCLAILVVIIICLGVYLGQRSSHKNNWDPKDGNNDAAEMQDTSLLTNRTKTPIVKSTKYPSEGTSEQTERLMGDSPTAPPAWQNLDEPIGNGNAHDVDKLPNGSDKEPIERVTTKVTTLPDSIPRTPVIRNT